MDGKEIKVKFCGFVILGIIWCVWVNVGSIFVFGSYWVFYFWVKVGECLLEGCWGIELSVLFVFYSRNL